MLDGQVANDTGVGALDDDFAKVGRHREQLENTDTAEITRTAAGVATRRLEDRPWDATISKLWRHTGHAGNRHLSAAAGTEPAHEPLRQHTEER